MLAITDCKSRVGRDGGRRSARAPGRHRLFHGGPGGAVRRWVSSSAHSISGRPSVTARSRRRCGSAAGFVVLAILILIVHRLTAGVRARRAADRRKADLTAVGVAAALAVLPGLLRGKGGPRRAACAGDRARRPMPSIAKTASPGPPIRTSRRTSAADRKDPAYAMIPAIPSVRPAACEISAVDAVRREVVLDLARKHLGEAAPDQDRSETLAFGRRDRRPAAFFPVEHEPPLPAPAFDAPCHLNRAGGHRERAVFHRVAGELVQDQAEAQRLVGRQKAHFRR